ncbi:MAG: hypothetical protein KAI43_13945 [Candidatus Aureabacteria bacterium]|nr:hypothetical protein [Candidatus Auribacterota bacterium]
MIFSYECQECQEIFDLLIGVTKEKSRLECPKCYSKDIIKLITAPAIKVKGSHGGQSCSTGCCPF